MSENLVNELFNRKVFEVLSIYLKDIKSHYHGREIARILNMNLKVAQDTLKILEKTNILKSEIKGRIKIYGLNISNPLLTYLLISAEAYRTSKFLENNYEIKKISDILNEYAKEVALIYGSYAKDSPTDKIDIDIAIIGKCDREKLNNEILIFPTKVHIIELKESQILKGILKKDPFVMEILRNHYVIKGMDKVVEWLIKYGKN